MLTRRALFKRFGQSALGLAVVPVLASFINAPVLAKYRYVARSGPTLAEIVTTTLRNRSGKLAENVMSNNALFQRMRLKNVAVTQVSSIEERL